jgi:hypothetical protein
MVYSHVKIPNEYILESLGMENVGIFGTLYDRWVNLWSFGSFPVLVHCRKKSGNPDSLQTFSRMNLHKKTRAGNE